MSTVINRLFLLPRHTKKAILIVADSICLPLALWLAFLLRQDSLFAIELLQIWLFFLVPVLSIPVFVRLGLYRAVIRYMGARAQYTIIKGVTLSVLGIFLCANYLFGMSVEPAVFGIYWVLALLYIGGSRLLVRDYFQEHRRDRDNLERVAIFGAGAAGVQLAMGLLSGREFQPVAFVDEKRDLVGSVINGIRVYSPQDLAKIIESQNIKQILLAIPSASRLRRRDILAQLETLPVCVRTIPGLADLVAGVAQVDDIQEVDIADLLGRDPVPPHNELLAKCITGKSVMVTGAGGSIGSELCRQILHLMPKCIVLFETSEFALYKMEQELKFLRASKEQFDGIDIRCVLGSVTHRRRVEAVIRSFGVQTIYHAAAYKHVPLVEHNPIEGVQNNLFGTWRTAEAALAADVETFVLVSTDKAVRPTNVMGATKRMSELVLQAMAERQGKTRFCMVRFGNVLGSSGSVVPLFRQQIRRGGPITVTHSEITRYFMTIPEAAQLVLQAGSMGHGGDVFVLDMGESVRIADLARRMIHLSGLQICDADNETGDIEITYTGLRPGEKLYEELLIGDNVMGTDHPRIMRVKEAQLEWMELSSILNSIEKACTSFNSAKVRKLLEASVSGYEPQCEIVDPVWHKLMLNKELEKLSALPVNVEELAPNRLVN